MDEDSKENVNSEEIGEASLLDKLEPHKIDHYMEVYEKRTLTSRERMTLMSFLIDDCLYTRKDRPGALAHVKKIVRWLGEDLLFYKKLIISIVETEVELENYFFMTDFIGELLQKMAEDGKMDALLLAELQRDKKSLANRFLCPRYPEDAEKYSILDKLKPANSYRGADWPWVIADVDEMDQYRKLYETADLVPFERITLMSIIVEACSDAMEMGDDSFQGWVFDYLKKYLFFYKNLILYYASLDSEQDDCWRISMDMRKLLKGMAFSGIVNKKMADIFQDGSTEGIKSGFSDATEYG